MLLIVLVAVGASAATPAQLSCGFGDGLRDTILQRANAARAAGASCGGHRLPPAPPLTWNDKLQAAAARHSFDMAQHNYFDHVTPEGRRVGQRVTAEGYNWRTVGENIAGGNRTTEAVMRGWMASEGHCRNIMNPDFREIGAACVEREGTTWGTYWTMALGRQR